VSASRLLREAIHEVAASYEAVCETYGEHDERTLQIADLLMFMRRWMQRWSDAGPAPRALETVRD